MKKSKLLGATLALAGLAIVPAFAQTSSTTTTTTSYMPTSTVIGSKVRSSNGEEIGEIKDVVLDKNTGCMAYTVLSTGGGSSTGRTASNTTRTTKTVAVPWTVFTPGSDARSYTVRVDREKIYNAPAWDVTHVDEYSRTDYLNNVYGYYGVQPSVGINVGTSFGVGAQTGGYNRSSTTTGVGASTAATASPAMSASPSMTATPAMSATPSATASASVSPMMSATPSVSAAASSTPYVKPTASATVSGASTSASVSASAKPAASASVAASSTGMNSSSATHQHAAGEKHEKATEKAADKASRTDATSEGTPAAKKGKAGSMEPAASPAPTEP